MSNVDLAKAYENFRDIRDIIILPKQRLDMNATPLIT